jgi:hypothetical protein
MFLLPSQWKQPQGNMRPCKTLHRRTRSFKTREHVYDDLANLFGAQIRKHTTSVMGSPETTCYLCEACSEHKGVPLQWWQQTEHR